MAEKVNDDHYGDVIGLNKGIGRAAAVISPLEVRRACTCFTCRIGQVRAADGDHIVSPYARCINEYSIKISKRWALALKALICSSYAIQKKTLLLSQFICPTLYIRIVGASAPTKRYKLHPCVVSLGSSVVPLLGLWCP